MKRQAGLTQIELLMAVTVMGATLTCAFDALKIGRLRLEQTVAQSVLDSAGRTAFNIIARDIRCAYIDPNRHDTCFAAPPDKTSFAQLDFTRATPTSDVDQDYTTIGYRVKRNATTNEPELWRQKNNGDSLLAGGVRAFDLKFFDGETWRNDWGWNQAEHRPAKGIRGLPLLVSVHLALTSDGADFDVTRRIPVMTSVINRQIYE